MSIDALVNLCLIIAFMILYDLAADMGVPRNITLA